MPACQLYVYQLITGSVITNPANRVVCVDFAANCGSDHISDDYYSLLQYSFNTPELVLIACYPGCMTIMNDENYYGICSVEERALKNYKICILHASGIGFVALARAAFCGEVPVFTQNAWRNQ